MSIFTRGKNQIKIQSHDRQQRHILIVSLLLAFAVMPLTLALARNGSQATNASPSSPLTVQTAADLPGDPQNQSYTLYLPYIAVNATGDAGNEGLEDEERIREEHQQEFLHEHMDENGQVRPDLWLKGLQDARQMKIAAGIPANASISALNGGLIGVQWKQVGPQPLRIDAEQNYQGAGPDSGEVVDIAIDPRGATDQVLYLATNDGGIWKSTNGGDTWLPKTDTMPSLSMGAVALDPGNPSIVYAGTGNPFDGAGIFSKGVGVYRSVDAGETWSVRGAAVFNNVQINRIAMPAPNVLLVAASNGLYRSIDGGLNFGSNAPAFNNGLPIINGFISDLDLDSANPATTVYASVRSQGVFSSTDGGITFPGNLFTASNGAPTAGNFAFIAFAQSVQQSGVSNNQIMYANVQGAGALSGRSAKLFKSINGGATWTEMTDAANRAAENGGCQCGYDQTVGVDPQDPNQVYIGYQELYVSTNGGTNFGTPAISRNKIHWDHHALTFSPGTHWGGGGAPTRIWVGTDGGVASSTDGGSNWANLNETIATNLFFSLDIGRGSAANNGHSYGGTQDTGTVERRPSFAGNDWHLGIDGDGGRVAVDPADPQRAYGTDNGCFIHTTDAGGNWNYCGATGLPGGLGLFAVDPNDSNVVYATAGVTLFQSIDMAASFTAIRAFPSRITALNMVALDSNTMWVGLRNGAVQRTGNVLAGTSSTWTALTVAGAPAGQAVTDIAIDPSNTQQAVVVYPGFTGVNPINHTRHVFRTTDNGTSWTDISGTDGGNPATNLPDLPLHSVVIDRGTSPHTIIVSSDAGVMRTANLGATWEVYGVGLPTVDSKELALDDSVSPSLLRIGTYGRSVFELSAATNPLIAVNTDLAFGVVSLNTSTSRVVQVFNVGSSDLHLASFTRLNGSADFEIISGPSTPVTIPAGEEVDFTVRFQPSVTGDLTATFQLNSDDPFQPAYQVFASGTGIGPKITVSGDLNFGVVARGAVATRSVIVQNTGGADLIVSSVAFDVGSDPEFSVVGPTTPQTVAPGSSVTFLVRFAPPLLAPGGTRTGTLRINSNDATSPSVTLPAIGTVGTPTFVVSSSSLQFGRIAVDDRSFPNSNDQILRLTNQASCAGCDVQILTASITGLAAADFTLVSPPPLPITVGAGSSLELVVRFNPADGAARVGLLTLTTSDPATPIVQIDLNGEGLLPGLLASPSPLLFGSVVYDPICSGVCGSTANAAIMNTGQAELILDTISFSGDPAFTGPVALLPPQRLPPYTTSNEAVTFHPTGGPARKVTGVLHFEDSLGPAPTAPPVATDIPLCGESVGRGIRVIVYDNNGNLVPTADRIKLQSHGLTHPVNEQVDNAPLTTIDPPASCQRIQFHYENQDLQATEVAGNRGSYYILTVDVGNKHVTLSFTLEVNEFKTIIATVQ